MELTKLIVTIAITFAMTITLAMKSIGIAEQKITPLNLIESSSSTIPKDHHQQQVPLREPKPMGSKRISRFLKEEAKNPRAADHCHKDEEVCYLQGGINSTCCNNKCVDLSTDNKNCGACKKKCKFTDVCCRGECVNVAFDKRHCGACNHRCKAGEYCVYGMCNYA